MALGIHRRVFLKSGALFALGSALPPFLATRLAAAKPAQGGAESKVLVCIFMRGGVDGLHMVPPIAEPEYYKERSSIALPEPGKGTGSALALDHRFGLHPKLASLLPLYREGRLAMVHAVGSPHPTRSHFDAQDYMENGTPGSSSSREGWLNRAMQLSSRADAAPLRAVAMNNALPRALTGRAPAIAIDDFKTFGLRGGPVRQRLEQGFQVLYSEPSDAITRSGNEALALIDFVRAKIPRDPKPGH
ncbi:MAG TPA: hypothetical protein VGJ84_07650, partial [Polyangiaceae bacterium]